MPKITHQQARRAGVLLHISSLPSGDFGDDAFRFVDFLAETGASVWQTLPLNMPHDDGSPYQCLSAHAGNPAFISLNALVHEHLLTKHDLIQQDSAESGANRKELLALAYLRYKEGKNAKLQKEFTLFCQENISWLGDFALFLVLREKFKHISWNTWPLAYKNKQPVLIKKLKLRYAHEIAVIKFTQFIFFKQWLALKAYANKKGVAMFGDIPIFVAFDSADVWGQPYAFKLDANRNTEVVAGVPPDYFSVTGQRWGNPHYNWPAMQANGFKWWLGRIRTQQCMFDLLRIDHFRGLQAAWEIPASEETAINGAWVEAPGDALLNAVVKRFPNMHLVAEDLGIITDEVDALREKYNLPGMKILQFAFGGDADNPYLPENIDENSVVYTGTHDNDTTLGWYQSLDDGAKAHLHTLLENEAPNMPQALVKLALSTKANLAIIPMQDILGLDGAHRMNIPGTMGGNWQWRFDWDAFESLDKTSIKNAIKSSGRANKWVCKTNGPAIKCP
jgi:4-alpha-glucanotransferase